MLASTDGDLVNSFHIFKDGKFTPQRQIRELTDDVFSSSAPECYHTGAQAAVPFLWESQPGTPKDLLFQTPLPPLTPPPSFLCTSAATPPLKKPSSFIKTRKLELPKFCFLRSHHHHAVRLSASSATSAQSLLSPASWSSSSPSVQSLSPVTPLCDYYYSRRYGFTFETIEDEKYYSRRSPSDACSPFMCFGTEKARKSVGTCSSMFKRLIHFSGP